MKPRNFDAISRVVLVSRDSFLIYSFISVFSVPLAITNFLTLQNFYLSIYIGISITVFIGLYIWCATQILLRVTSNNLHNFKIQIVNFLIIASAGALRGAIIYYSFNLVGIPQPSQLPVRILTSTATTIFWLKLLSIIVEDQRRYQERFQSLIRGSILHLSQETRQSASRNQNAKYEEEFKGIENLIQSVLDETVRTSHTKNDLLRSASNIRLIVEEIIRPMSHRIWLKNETAIPRFKLWATIQNSICNINISPMAISGFLFLLSIFNLPVDFGVIKGIQGATVIFIATFGVLKIFKLKIFAKSKSTITQNNLLILLAGTIISLILYVYNKFLLNLNSANFSFIFIVLIFIACVLSSVREHTVDDRNQLIEKLKNSLENFSKSSTFKYSSEDVASFLHNSLQSELMALSFQLEEAAEEPFSEKTREVLERAGARISRSISGDFQDFLEEPLQRLSRLKSSWSGIANIELNLPDSLELESARQFLLVQIIEEGINNAVRSAGAKNIAIAGQQTAQNGFMLTIRNDGHPETWSNRGFGSHWLDIYVSGNWERRSINGETVLEIIL